MPARGPRLSRRRVVETAESINRRIDAWLTPPDRTVPGMASTSDDSPAGLLAAARRADAATVASFASQRTNGPGQRAYRRSANWLLAGTIRGYRVARRLRGSR